MIIWYFIRHYRCLSTEEIHLRRLGLCNVKRREKWHGIITIDRDTLCARYELAVKQLRDVHVVYQISRYYMANIPFLKQAASSISMSPAEFLDASIDATRCFLCWILITTVWQANMRTEKNNFMAELRCKAPGFRFRNFEKYRIDCDRTGKIIQRNDCPSLARHLWYSFVYGLLLLTSYLNG